MDSSLGPEAGAGMLVRRPVDMGGVDAPKLAEKIVKNVSAAFTVSSTRSLCSKVLLHGNPTHLLPILVSLLLPPLLVASSHTFAAIQLPPLIRRWSDNVNTRNTNPAGCFPKVVREVLE
jgi:hypothetical protein